jgi:hypothetical protein
MNRVSHFIAIAVVSLCLSAVSKGDEIQFTTLPQPVQTTVIERTKITNPQQVVRVVRNSGIYAITVDTASGRQVFYVNPAGTIVQPAGQVVTTTTTEPSEIVISQGEIHEIGTRYQLLKRDHDKAVYRDLQTGEKIKIEMHD